MTTAPSRTPAPTRQQAPTTGLQRLVPATPPPIVPRIVMTAVEKWGKTTLFAYADAPLILMAPQEDGYLTLLSKHEVPAVPAVTVPDWETLLRYLDDLAADAQGRKTLVLDAIGGFEKLCHEYVCRTQFKSDWGEAGFMGFMRGYDRSVPEWLKLLARLDRLHDRGIVVALLAHTRTKTFNDPAGPAYDRYEPDVHAKTWAPTARWADCILFGQFESFVTVGRAQAGKNIADQKGKAIGTDKRIIRTRPQPAFPAGNRYSLPETIDMPDDRSQMWAELWRAITTKENQQ